VLEAVQAALAVDGERHLSVAERATIDAGLTALRDARAGGDPAAIKRAIAVVDDATREFAARRMDASVQAVLAGHRLEEFSK
jgi:molecular chaperone HscA